MKIIKVIVEGGDGSAYIMTNPIFKVKYPEGDEVTYDLQLNMTGMEIGKDRRIIVMKPVNISKDVSITKGG